MTLADQERVQRRPFVRLVDRLATITITLIVDILVLLMLVVLVWSVVALTIAIWHTIMQRDVAYIKDLVVGVLTVFVIIEIFDLFREYARSSHVKVTNLAEVSLAVVLRELWLLLLDGSTDWRLYLALGGLVVALAAFWYLAARAETRVREPEIAEAPAARVPASDDEPLPALSAPADPAP